MLQDIQVVGGSVLTLFLMMAVGFFFGKKGMLTGQALSQVSKILLYVVTPCIMITSFQVERTPAAVRELLISAAALVGTYVLYMVLAPLCFRRRPAEERGVLRFATVYGNTGFMGIPLIQAVLGSEAMLPTMVCMVVFNVSTWTHGVMLLGGRKELSVKKAVLNPGVIGFVIALALFATGLRLPGPVNSAVEYLGSMNSPLAMVVIGGQMAAVNLGETFKMKKLYAASLLKLLAVPAVTALVLLPFHLDKMVFMTVVILSGCPTAGATSLFCQNMGRDSSLAARLVTLSTLLCIITLPLVALAARMLGGM